MADLLLTDGHVDLDRYAPLCCIVDRPEGTWDDDAVGLMRVHVAQSRIRALSEQNSHAELSAYAKGQGLAGGGSKRDLAERIVMAHQGGWPVTRV